VSSRFPVLFPSRFLNFIASYILNKNRKIKINKQTDIYLKTSAIQLFFFKSNPRYDTFLESLLIGFRFIFFWLIESCYVSLCDFTIKGELAVDDRRCRFRRLGSRHGWLIEDFSTTGRILFNVVKVSHLFLFCWRTMLMLMYITFELLWLKYRKH
jgi:hypothetical protein